MQEVQIQGSEAQIQGKKGIGLISLLRPLNCSMAAAAVLIGFFVSGGGSLGSAAIAAVAAFAITGGGMLLNDFFDLEIDRRTKPERAKKTERYLNFLPGVASVLFAAGIAISSEAGTPLAILAAVNSLILTVYSPFLKPVPLLGNLAVSYLVASAFVFGSLASSPNIPVLILSSMAFASTLAREIVKDLSDAEGDRNWRKTLALKNPELAKKISVAGTISALAISPLPVIYGASWLYLLGLAPSAALFLRSIFLDPERSEKTMKFAMLFGLLAFVLGVV